jgi:hypothetical protein
MDPGLPSEESVGIGTAYGDDRFLHAAQGRVAHRERLDLEPRRSAKRVYMRSRSAAKSAASSPPVPARISRSRSGLREGRGEPAAPPARARSRRFHRADGPGRLCTSAASSGRPPGPAPGPASVFFEASEPIGGRTIGWRRECSRPRAENRSASLAADGSESAAATSAARASAWRSRASTVYCAAVGAACSEPYLRRNRSTRPAVSIRRCLPVKYGDRHYKPRRGSRRRYSGSRTCSRTRRPLRWCGTWDGLWASRCHSRFVSRCEPCNLAGFPDKATGPRRAPLGWPERRNPSAEFGPHTGNVTKCPQNGNRETRSGHCREQGRRFPNPDSFK